LGTYGDQASYVVQYPFHGIEPSCFGCATSTVFSLWHQVFGGYWQCHGHGAYKIAQLLPPEDDDFQYKIKSTAERMSRRSRKTSLIAPDNAGTLIEGYMMTFDYAASAELFMPKRKRGARQQLSYRRFATATEAIRFAVEELPTVRTLGAWMQVGEERFNSGDIQRLYESANYPRRPRRRKSG
jgi:hypothetical protein